MSDKNIKNIEAVTEIKEGKLTAIASTEDMDRSGDVLRVNDWDFTKFKLNPVLQAGHDYRPQYTVGIAKNLRVEGNCVVFEPVFHTITPLAKQIKEMYEKGFLKAWSVGFIPGDGKELKHDLLEISSVAVPDNAYALMKGFSASDEELEVEVKEWMELETKEVEEEETDEDKIEETEDETTEADVEDITGEEQSEKETTEEETSTIVGKSKEAWNKDLPAVFHKSFSKKEKEVMLKESHKRYCDYFGVKVSELKVTSFTIPSPLIGTYLKGIETIFEKYEKVEERNWSGNYEEPLVYEDIQLTSKEVDNFLVKGTRFYKSNLKDESDFIYEIFPDWGELRVNIVTPSSQKEFNNEIVKSIHDWANENNLLKGEKFDLSGAFIKEFGVKRDNIFLSEKSSNALKLIEKTINEGKGTRGVLMIGEPGTGKTVTGKYLRDNSDATFIWVSARDMQKFYYSAGYVINLGFSMARSLAPSILMFEDIDNSLDVDLLKTELDGMIENDGVVTILTSNHPDKLPDSLLDRPGRFHDVLHYSLPDNDTRKQMIAKWAGVSEKDVEDIAEQLEGYSGAYIKELVTVARQIQDDEGIEIKEALQKGLDKITEQRALVETIRQDKKGYDTLKKEGRIISKSNLFKIKSAKEALDDVIELASKEEGTTTEEAPKKQTPKKTVKKSALSQEELFVKTLQSIVKKSNEALHERKMAQ